MLKCVMIDKHDTFCKKFVDGNDKPLTLPLMCQCVKGYPNNTKQSNALITLKRPTKDFFIYYHIDF